MSKTEYGLRITWTDGNVNEFWYRSKRYREARRKAYLTNALVLSLQQIKKKIKD